MSERQKILVVDDSASNRQLLGELLQADYTVLLAKNGEQALLRARDLKPDLILLDVMMPEMDGYEVLRLLKADPQTAPIGVIFITGLDTPDDEERGLLMGASDYITKPFHSAVVKARVAVHMQVARQRRMLEILANIDALTELPNRRQLDVVLAAECSRAGRTGNPLSVALLDVDYFKLYNDYYGHAMGDRVLQTIASVLNGKMKRPSDLAARYGGEEFVLIMPDTLIDGALELAQELCQAIASLQIPHEKSKDYACVTVSIGIASSSAKVPPTAESLLQVADARLYHAKAAGRNRALAT
ncbi:MULTISPECIES: diguanylate cyclase [Deefgea]|uniref:diguanylate cyclase n=1 Tax=Deefgea chitinilytica TaxID=570276 RepID=A0ABS2CEK2_9NEIS|nr:MULTISPECIES: diguanylate cyclase [Deefgea]MBM5572581.1 diguanylate cyclase [Deefgea chitinilytica]MBM9889817.1 diguanylate cyclase [Deefgea sp. CFH1-16]